MSIKFSQEPTQYFPKNISSTKASKDCNYKGLIIKGYNICKIFFQKLRLEFQNPNSRSETWIKGLFKNIVSANL